MGSILVFSLIIAIVFTLIVVPHYPNLSKKKKVQEEVKRNKGAEYIGVFALIWIVIFGFYYLSNIDRTISSLWFLLLIATALGTVSARGREQLVKGALLLASLVLMVYMLSAFLFNANEKYTVSKMEEKVEIQAFDETKTPASVPPHVCKK